MKMRRALVLLLLVPMAVGCGAARSSDPGVDGAADKAAAAGSSRISISYGGRAYYSGEFDFKREVGVFAWGSRSRDGDWDQIITPEATYTRFRPEDLGGPDAGRTWLKSPASGEHDGLFGIFPSDPVRVLGVLKAASEVQKVGTGEERGVKVTRYETRLDVDRAVDALGPDRGDGENLRATIRQFWPDSAPEGIPLELAVDAEGLLRRVDVVIPVGERLSVEFFDYGLDVAVKPPPAEEILSWQEFVRLMEDRCSEQLEEDGGQTQSLCAGAELIIENPIVGEEPND